MSYCVIKGKLCDWTTADGYCSVTACKDYDKVIPSNGMIYVPVEWLKTKPEVKAIPVEWLKQWEEKHKNDPCYCGFVSEEIIKDWEKENEIDDLLPNCVKHARVMKEIENQLEDRNGK